MFFFIPAILLLFSSWKQADGMSGGSFVFAADDIASERPVKCAFRAGPVLVHLVVSESETVAVR